jgi:predicted nuclease of predicted toxin-antitoxin system
MKFLVDAQLPIRLSIFLRDRGFDSIHTVDLPNKNQTSDIDIIKRSMVEKRVVISKDADFYNSFLRKAEPYKLIFLRVGNMSTDEVIKLFEKNMQVIVDQISRNLVVEISSQNIITII